MSPKAALSKKMDLMMGQGAAGGKVPMKPMPKMPKTKMPAMKKMKGMKKSKKM